jgi:hypothetical protein
MFIWFAIQTYIIYILVSVIYTLVTGKPINEAAGGNLFIVSGIISVCITLGVILWPLISTKASKSSKKSSNIDYKDPFNMTHESMMTISHQMEMAGGQFWRNVPGRERPPVSSTAPPFSTWPPEPPQPPPPPPPPMPWN